MVTTQPSAYSAVVMSVPARMRNGAPRLTMSSADGAAGSRSRGSCRTAQREPAQGNRNRASADPLEGNRAGRVGAPAAEPHEIAVLLDQVRRDVTVGVAVTDDAVGELAALGKHASGNAGQRLIIHRGPARLFVGRLPGKHDFVSQLPGFALGQFAGGHVPIGDVMPVAAGRVSDLGDVFFACHHVVSLVR